MHSHRIFFARFQKQLPLWKSAFPTVVVGDNVEVVKRTKSSKLALRRVRGPQQKALKSSRTDGRRSSNGEALARLDRQVRRSRPVTCAELADALERASAVLTHKEHRQIARHIEEARSRMAYERLH